MTAQRSAVFRCDASLAVGGGHVHRCLALADTLAWAGWKCGFAVAPGAEAVVPALATSAISLVHLSGDCLSEPSELRTRWPDGCDLLVVDHYGRDATFEAACRPWARLVLAIDDLANRTHDCDVLLNSALDPGARYDGAVSSRCRCLFGPKYALLRQEFRLARPPALLRRGKTDSVKRILISFGATDVQNATAVAMQAIVLAKLDVAVDVLLGPAAPARFQVEALAQTMSQRVSVHVDSNEVAAVMSQADVAIGAAGSSSWERACLGLPSLVTVCADNQRHISDSLLQAGVAEGLGEAAAVTAPAMAETLRRLCTDTSRRRRMATAAANLCDGRGTLRAMLAVIGLAPARNRRPVTLRLAEESDCATMFAWQQDERTRRYFRNAFPPSLEEHTAWFERCLSDPRRILTVIQCGSEAVGALRFDPIDDESTYEISILIAPGCYRMGFAKAALALGRRMLPAAELRAHVLPGNTAAKSLFESAGYVARGESFVHEATSCDLPT